MITGVAEKTFLVSFPTQKTKKGEIISGFENFKSIQDFFKIRENLDFSSIPFEDIDDEEVEKHYILNIPSYGIINISGGADINLQEAAKWKSWAKSNQGKVPLMVIAAGNEGKELKNSKAVEKTATSFAAPIVAGAATLLLGCKRNLNANELKTILLNSAKKYGL